ncbi:MAG: prepilin-type N-terminal cleavage/methylation domain-containing protein [Patescibacteria group bacterium]
MEKTNLKGYTLIELLVVLAIIGILVSMGMSELRGTREVARDATRISDLSQIRLALDLYFDDNGYYPSPIAGDGAGFDKSTDTVSGTVFSQLGNPLFPGYISRVFSDPMNSTSQAYYYYYDTNQNDGHRAYVFCYHKEASTHKWLYFYSTGVYGEGDICPILPN